MRDGVIFGRGKGNADWNFSAPHGARRILKRTEVKNQHTLSEFKLEFFLYEAIFIPEGIEPPPREIIFSPELQIYIKNFGEGRADFCFVAEIDKKIVGAAWSRIMNDYGHIDDQTPSLALSVLKNYRHQGIATTLMKNLLEKIFVEGFQQVSLSVQKENEIALNFYKKFGFEIYRENNDDLIMICKNL